MRHLRMRRQEERRPGRTFDSAKGGLSRWAVKRTSSGDRIFTNDPLTVVDPRFLVPARGLHDGGGKTRIYHGVKGWWKTDFWGTIVVDDDHDYIAQRTL